MTKGTGKISRLSKFGYQLDGVDTWYNVSQYKKDISLSAFSVGDTIEHEQNDKGYVEKLKKTQSANPNATGGTTQPTSGGQSASTQNTGNDSEVSQKDLRITRESALKTAFGALPSLKSEGDSLGDLTAKAEILTKRLTLYILTGKFEDEVPF